ncbi:MAG: helix-turn-helix domain-containing protein [Phenylobacterium sp.]
MSNSARAPDVVIDAHIGRMIRLRRRQIGLTQHQLALACGVRFQQIQKYESGANRIAASRLWRISRATGTPLLAFFEGLPETLDETAP